VDCCSGSSTCAEFFGERLARRSLSRYRENGLPADGRTMVEWAAGPGIEGATVLEVGGGIGAVAVELLGRGAAGGENIEVVAAWEPFARELIRDRRLEGRLAFRVADVVALQRVVCCNPEGVRLTGIAAGLARRVLVLSYPRNVFWTRWPIKAQNLLFRLLGRAFRAFVHDPERILAAAEEAGLQLEHRRRGLVWEVAALRRA
jgi:hypothetical protein